MPKLCVCVCVFNTNSVCFLFTQEVQTKSKVCANVFCGAGRECAVTEKGEPSCLCIEVSPIMVICTVYSVTGAMKCLLENFLTMQC